MRLALVIRLGDIANPTARNCGSKSPLSAFFWHTLPFRDETSYGRDLYSNRKLKKYDCQISRIMSLCERCTEIKKVAICTRPDGVLQPL